jgi:hypothetical protein
MKPSHMKLESTVTRDDKGDREALGWDFVMWTGLVWLRIGTGGELL